MDIFLQAISGSNVRLYKHAVENPIPISRLRPHLEESVLLNLEPFLTNDSVCVWGNPPRLDSSPTPREHWDNPNSFERRLLKPTVPSPTSLVLFASGQRIHHLSTVIETTRNKELAEELWGIQTLKSLYHGRVTEVMKEGIFFFTTPIGINISYQDMNKALGRSVNFPIVTQQSLNKIPSWKADGVLHLLMDKVPIDELINSMNVAGTEEPLDKVATAILRREQAWLRQSLFGNEKYTTCGICGEKYPVDLLIAAHIKQRSECTDSEKADIPNIAMPMCLMGCDSLYEKGYLTVLNGVVKVISNTDSVITEKLQSLSGNVCRYWSNNNESYFRWHNLNRFRGET